MSFILGILSWVLGKLFGKPTGPSQEAVAAKEAGAAEAVVQADTGVIAAQQREAQAVVDAPSDKTAVVSELNKGTF